MPVRRLKVNKHIECPNSTQMEKIILIQALVYLSNQLPSFESRVTFINELISPTFKFFTSEEFQFKIKDAISFVGYIGLNDSSKQSVDIASTLTNRKQIFYHVNLLFAIVKSLDLTNDNNNQLMRLYRAIFNQILIITKTIYDTVDVS